MLEINNFHNGISRITRNTARVLVVLFVAFAVMTVGIRPASAQTASPRVNVCQALTLYGNAAREGLCKNLSTGTNWVCELAKENNLDIHTTFNATTPFHITVRPCPAGERSDLTGTWPNSLIIAQNQPITLCGVSIQTYVDKLNKVTQVNSAPAPETLCTTAFKKAVEAGKIDGTVANFYKDKCKVNRC